MEEPSWAPTYLNILPNFIRFIEKFLALLTFGSRYVTYAMNNSFVLEWMIRVKVKVLINMVRFSLNAAGQGWSL